MASPQPIPGPRGKPFIGMIPEMMNDMLGMFMNLAREHRGIVNKSLNGS
ncbi:MAG TPA: hypothetical protein VFR47_14610 [Anaerolineales bacterium]|nr:hypothetical protein [Anaerolineales bacterium]